MAAPPKQDKAEAQAAGRRSTRLFISIPITISGKDSAGHTFKENTKTLIINKHGAKITTVHQVALGAELTVENRALGRTAKGNVVWLGVPDKDTIEIIVGRIVSPFPFLAIHGTEAQNIWGIEFPPDDWGISEKAGVRFLEEERTISEILSGFWRRVTPGHWLYYWRAWAWRRRMKKLLSGLPLPPGQA